MGFFSKYSFIIIWIAIIGVAGVLFVFIVQPNFHLSSTGTASGPGINQTVTTPATPAQPVVTLMLQKTKNGGTLIVQWNNLPANTTALNIFRGVKNSTTSWTLWKSIKIDPQSLASGNASLNLGTKELGYSYFVEAVNDAFSDSSSTSGFGSGPSVLWTSSVSEPVVTTSTLPVMPSGNNASSSPVTPPPNNNPSSSNPAPAASSTSTGTPPPTPSGIPYYSPNFQTTEYGSDQTQNFWVQHIDNKIQIGWQNLPPPTTSVVILRSSNQDGPWAVVLTQQNPGVNGAYSIQVIDDTLGTPYFYKMDVQQGSTTIATYGPTYLPGN